MADLSHLSPESALRSVLLLALTCWAAWWVLGLAVAVVDRRAAARIGPPLLRALLVAGTIAATAVPTQASQSNPGTLDGLPMPQRPLTSAPTPVASDPVVNERAHIVVAGDCLWSIVRNHSPGLSDRETAAAVARWHDTNRDIIGADPDLIWPGQRLVPPGAS